ncbi:MAG: hypothetical protein PHQ53_06055, partial [Candidatus Krumholzibacteria bacterium]|nr:hypothetical protein [Candidatus Krumholzibacteria bacterium]
MNWVLRCVGVWLLASVFGNAAGVASMVGGGPADTTKATGRVLAGEIGSSSQWGSGWLDLAMVTDFTKGDVLRLRIGGSAKKVVVRLLPKTEPQETSAGIIGGAVVVPESRVVEVILDTDRKFIKQISVHGGTNPWGKFPLGSSNGPATLETAELVNCVPAPKSSADTTKATGRVLAGEIGSSPQWGSGWLDLATVADFKKGDALRLRIGG